MYDGGQFRYHCFDPRNLPTILASGTSSIQFSRHAFAYEFLSDDEENNEDMIRGSITEVSLLLL